MKKILFSLVFTSLLSLQLFAQDTNIENKENNEEFLRNSVTVGVLQGGGSLVGIDVETLITKQLGVQLGAGFLGFGGGINFHFKPNIRSTFISFQYWHQGIGNSHTQTVIGPNLVYRSKKWFTAQIGAGYVSDRGPAFPDNLPKTPVILMYAIGAYFPF